MPSAPGYTRLEAWGRLDTLLVEHWVNGETEVKLDLSDVGRMKVAEGAPFYTFAHEIGHNLGCNHAADQGLVPGLFPIRMAGGLLVETGRSTGRYCPISVSLMNVGLYILLQSTRAL